MRFNRLRKSPLMSELYGVFYFRVTFRRVRKSPYLSAALENQQQSLTHYLHYQELFEDPDLQRYRPAEGAREGESEEFIDVLCRRWAELNWRAVLLNNYSILVDRGQGLSRRESIRVESRRNLEHLDSLREDLRNVRLREEELHGADETVRQKRMRQVQKELQDRSYENNIPKIVRLQAHFRGHLVRRARTFRRGHEGGEVVKRYILRARIPPQTIELTIQLVRGQPPLTTYLITARNFTLGGSLKPLRVPEFRLPDLRRMVDREKVLELFYLNIEANRVELDGSDSDSEGSQLSSKMVKKVRVLFFFARTNFFISPSRKKKKIGRRERAGSADGATAEGCCIRVARPLPV